MLTLFYKPSCPFCHRVLAVVEDLDIKIQLKDIGVDSVAKNELIEKGGKLQVPFLVDSERGVSLFESGEIVTHLEKFYSKENKKGQFKEVRIHKSGGACQSCQ